MMAGMGGTCADFSGTRCATGFTLSGIMLKPASHGIVDFYHDCGRKCHIDANWRALGSDPPEGESRDVTVSV